MPRPKRSGPRRRPEALEHLTMPQEFELVVGPARGGRLSAFADDFERRAAWALHRDRMRAEGPPPSWADQHYRS